MEFRNELKFLGNMFPAAIRWQGAVWQCSEAAYQASKTNPPQAWGNLDGYAAKKAGRELILRPDWNDVKVRVMADIVRTKFTQHPELLAKLRELDGHIEETNQWHDGFWGVCSCTRCRSVGQNWLGRILMTIRDTCGLRFTPEVIEETKQHEVFVFGSNAAGVHGAGAAKTALRWGAVHGVGVGLSGRTYAIPTKDKRIKTLPLADIQRYVDEFLAFASTRPDLVFLVTRIGCGLAGYTKEDIAPMFLSAPPNCVLPKDWTQIRVTRGHREFCVDTSIKSSQGVARPFAPPSWELVMGHKNGKVSDDEYREVYRAHLGKATKEQWRALFQLVRNRELTLGCYCVPAKPFCHNEILADFIVEKWPKVFYR